MEENGLEKHQLCLAARCCGSWLSGGTALGEKRAIYFQEMALCDEPANRSKSLAAIHPLQLPTSFVAARALPGCRHETQ
jgi:hypothetical protein